MLARPMLMSSDPATVCTKNIRLLLPKLSHRRGCTLLGFHRAAQLAWLVPPLAFMSQSAPAAGASPSGTRAPGRPKKDMFSAWMASSTPVWPVSGRQFTALPPELAKPMLLGFATASRNVLCSAAPPVAPVFLTTESMKGSSLRMHSSTAAPILRQS